MKQRHDICDGDTTTAKGVVMATSRTETLNGRALAYEGDPVWCPECKTTGRIVCAGERLPNRGPDGREQALSYDWCLCKCNPKPLLIASQGVSGMRLSSHYKRISALCAAF
ncbi:PAAR domain-containing protein [Cupriavidus necator]|uniref:PAAR domain-containing protein n=2 Tax=Cupriavidus necator TaxID=106590 RepID=A0A1U9URL5_CUPNE|nr:PAAR domain-containing protein [Cupriavidus necator]AQV94901.1 PAAR domain-containing protein [Cupriavidus necator]